MYARELLRGAITLRRQISWRVQGFGKTRQHSHPEGGTHLGSDDGQTRNEVGVTDSQAHP